jgi:poly(3-hydroxybutyrate) depolymerase
MTRARKTKALAVLAGLGMLVSQGAVAQPKEVLGARCETPPPFHCPDAHCPAEVISAAGTATLPGMKRKFFLDYPCDLKPGEKVTFILNLHGGGSNGNWQRHYFPLMDFKEKYRLVIATPSGVVRGWVPENDDAHLHNIVKHVFEVFGPENIRAFWLAGHSQGGMTSSRLICTDFFRDKVDGWVSLSGGRAATPRDEIRVKREAGSGMPVSAEQGSMPPPPRFVDKGEMPACEFSHIYSSGEHELPSTGLPTFSRWAERLGCGPRMRLADVVDTKPGYVYDTRELQNPTAEWGGKPAPGVAQVYVYPNCAHGRVVADIIRMNKGHTEGLEPNVTEQIVKLMLSAKPRKR